MNNVITNIIVVTMNKKREVISSGFVAWKNDIIYKIGDMNEFDHWESQNPGFHIEDGEKGILMPGMINLHCHMGMIPFRGLGDDCKDRLRVFLLPMEQKAMNEAMVYESTKYAAAEMLLNGVTTVVDMYYYEKEAARAMDEMGIRGIAGQSVMENGSCDIKEWKDALKYGEELILEYKDNPRITGCITPHADNTCSPELLKAAHDIDAKYDVPYTLHVAEMDYEMEYFKKMGYGTPVQFLERIGVLDNHTIAAHAIRINKDDIEVLNKTGASVAHCIGSNTKAAKGVAPVKSLREKNVAVGFGTDGPASGNTLDIFTQMKLCADFHKNENHDRSAFPAKDIVAMATIEGAVSLNMEKKIGSIEEGKQADMVLIETKSMNMFPVYDPYSSIVYSAGPMNVRDVFVAGDCLVKDGKLQKYEISYLRNRLEKIMRESPFSEYMMI